MTDRDSNVVSWPHPTIAPMSGERVVIAAVEHGVEPLVVIGYDHEGKLYVAGTHSEIADILVLLRLAQRYFEDVCWDRVAP